MRTRKVTLAILAVLALAAFAGGLAHLFAVRFSTGEMYPPYSSLRADPLGTKAMYEALAEMPSMTVGRNYQPLEQLDPAAETTLFYIGGFPSDGHAAGSQPASEPAKDSTTRSESQTQPGKRSPLEAFVLAGGRLVIAFSPAQRAPSGEVKSLLDELGVSVSSWPSQVHVARRAKLTEGIDALRGGEFTWHGQCSFTGLAAPWRTIASCNGKPVLIDRPWGKGRLVVSADAYFLSNEGLWRERQPDLLSWMAGGRRIIFDETHLGVTESAGISDLARRLRLEGLFVCLLLVALLFVWKSAVPFLPRDAELAERMSGQAVEGRAAASALLGLIRASIPAGQLLSTCVSEWARSCPANSPALRKAPAVQKAASDEESQPARQRDVAAAYRSICRILTERKTRK